MSTIPLLAECFFMFWMYRMSDWSHLLYGRTEILWRRVYLWNFVNIFRVALQLLIVLRFFLTTPNLLVLRQTLRQTCVKSSKGKLTVCSMHVVHELAIPTFYRFAYSCASALRRGRLRECSSDKEFCWARCTAPARYLLYSEVVIWKAIHLYCHRPWYVVLYMYLFMLISWLHDVCVGNKKAMEAIELAQPEEPSTKNADGANNKTVTKASVKAKKGTKRNRKESDKVKSSTCNRVHVMCILLWTLGSPTPPNITTSLTAKQTSAEQTTLTAKQTSAEHTTLTAKRHQQNRLLNCQANVSRTDYFNCQADSRTDYWQANNFIGRTYLIILIGEGTYTFFLGDDLFIWNIITHITDKTVHNYTIIML